MKRPSALFTLWLLVLTSSLVASGCTERRRRAKQTREALIAKYVGVKATKPKHALQVTFGNAVDLVGYDIDTEQVEAGRPFTVTWHWKVRKALDPQWKQFTHLLDGEGSSRVNLDENRTLFTALPCSAWRRGQYIRDPQEITVPRGWHSDGFQLALGFWHDEERLPVTAGEHDGSHRVMALTLRLGHNDKTPSPAKRPLRELVVQPKAGPIELDGKLEDPGWRGAAESDALVNTMRGTQGAFGARVGTVFDDQALYVSFQVEDDFLKSDFSKVDEHLWEQDAVEIMVDPDGDGRNYFEMQVSPKGVVFDTRYDARRDPQPFGHVDWNSQLDSAVSLRGTIDDEPGDGGYTVELRIPWTAFAHGPTKAQPPKPGDTWRANFFVMDARERGQRAVGWSAPMVGDFHTLDRFGKLRFAGPAASAEPAPQPTPPASPPPKPATAKP